MDEDDDSAALYAYELELRQQYELRGNDNGTEDHQGSRAD